MVLFVDRIIQKMEDLNENLLKEIEAKDLMISLLISEILELKEKNKLVINNNELENIDTEKDRLNCQIMINKQKQKINELEEEIKQISLENEQKRKILEKNGIEIIGGEEIIIPTEDIIEKYQNENEQLKIKIKNLEEITDYTHRKDNLIKSIVYGNNMNILRENTTKIIINENLKLKEKMKEYENEIKLLKKNNEDLLKENEHLLKENKDLLKENEDLNIKYKELEKIKLVSEKKEFEKKNKIINSISNFNINNNINYGDVNSYNLLINRNLKDEDEKFENEK